MKREVKYIKTPDGGKLPYICTNNVLAALQKEYGSIDAFYLALIGKELALDEDGRERHDNNGRRLLNNCEPDITAANIFLADMVNEALQIQGEKEQYTVEEVVRKSDMPVFMRVPILAAAFDECFYVGEEEKKSKPSRKAR